MTSSMVVPVIDVQNDNFKELWPAMVLAMQTSSFIAVDTELSGLGARKALLAECIEDRYRAICLAARTRSVLSLGLACYKKLDNKEADSYLVQVYNLTLLCSDEYVIEPQSVQFLVQHGFDFNKQYAQGVSYYKGKDAKGGGDSHVFNMRNLFTELLRARRPLVLHNGLIDMVFLYQCFYAHLPDKLGTFTADLSQMFPSGIYDTKYATEYQLRFPASYLEYAYKKCKLDNSRGQEEAGEGGSGGPRLLLEFCKYSGHMDSYVDYRPCVTGASPEGGAEPDVCQRFSAYGWCPNGSQCPQSHDTDLIIKQDEKSTEDKKKKKRKKRNKNKKDGQKGETGEGDLEDAPESKKARKDLDPEEGVQAQAKPLPGNEQGNGVKEEKNGVKEEGNGVKQEEAAHGGDDHVNTDEPKVEGNGISEPVSESQAPSADGVTPDPQTETAPPLPGVATTTTTPDAKKAMKMEGGTHRAGFDAFMTGYIFAFASALTERPADGAPWLPDCLNKVYLSGKAVPLNIVKSTFSSSSKAHVHKMELVWGKSWAGKAAGGPDAEVNAKV